MKVSPAAGRVQRPRPVAPACGCALRRGRRGRPFWPRVSRMAAWGKAALERLDNRCGRSAFDLRQGRALGLVGRQRGRRRRGGIRVRRASWAAGLKATVIRRWGGFSQDCGQGADFVLEQKPVVLAEARDDVVGIVGGDGEVGLRRTEGSSFRRRGLPE